MPQKRPWLALSLGALIFALGSGLALWAYQTEQHTLRADLARNAEIIGRNLLQVLRVGMADNAHDQVRQTVASTVGHDAVAQARIIGLNGKVYADSGWEMQGGALMTTGPGCVVCHRYPELPTVAALPFLPQRLRVATAIPNDSTCNSCHNVPNRATLGVILVDVDLTERATRAQTALVLELLGAALGGALVAWGVSGFPRPAWSLRAARGAFSNIGRRLSWPVVGIGLGLLLLFAGGGFTVVHLEENNEFCASCHTEPETAYVQRTSAAPVDLASAHAVERVACIACHSGEGAVGRVDAFVLGAQNVVRFVSGNYQSPTQAQTPIHTDHCTKCHSNLLSTLSTRNHFHYYTPQWDNPTACVACHPAHPTDRTAETGYTLESDVRPACEACHQVLGSEE